MAFDHTPEETTLNREAWLQRFVSLAIPVIRQRTGHTPQQPVKISCGFPLTGGRPRKGGGFTAGECFVLPPSTERKYHQIFVHPSLVKPLDVGGTVFHEVLHAALPHGVGHRRPFSQAAKKLGLEGKPTHAGVKEGTELADVVEEIVAQLGDYPHEGLSPSSGPKQTTRLIKVMCPMCGYVCRVTYKWIDEAGCPVCPQDMIPMEAGVGAEASLPLIAIDQTVEYKVKAVKKHLLDRAKFDPRWSIRMNRKGGVTHWWVIDYGPPEQDGMAVLGIVQPLLTIAESREDAISLLEALRDGSMTYDDIEERDHHEPDEDEPDLGDPGDWTDDEEYLEEEEDEVQDNPDGESGGNLLFQWEKDRGITADDIDPEAEERKREAWVKE